MAESDLSKFNLKDGTVIGEWKTSKKLGAGGFGCVYLVESVKIKKYGALKIEPMKKTQDSQLIVEVQALNRLKNVPYVLQILHSGRKKDYRFMVVQLLGKSLADSIRDNGRKVGVSTQLRIGIYALYGLKQLHDVGFIHRDFKPGNLVLGSEQGSTDPNFIYVIDFGMVRQFIVLDKEGKVGMRKPRSGILYRGTNKYFSVSVHKRKEQGRHDDLWSMLYTMAEARLGNLPWNSEHENPEVLKIKLTVSDEELFANSPIQVKMFADHLRTLDYTTRPDYSKLYKFLLDAMILGGYSFSDPFEWNRDSSRTSTERKMKPPFDDSVFDLNQFGF